MDHWIGNWGKRSCGVSQSWFLAVLILDGEHTMLCNNQKDVHITNALFTARMRVVRFHWADRIQ